MTCDEWINNTDKWINNTLDNLRNIRYNKNAWLRKKARNQAWEPYIRELLFILAIERERDSIISNAQHNLADNGIEVGPLISGIVSSNFSDETKKTLRQFTVMLNENDDAALTKRPRRAHHVTVKNMRFNIRAFVKNPLTT